MRLLACFLLFAATLSGVSQTAQSSSSTPENAVQALAFLSGRWTSDSPDDEQEEYWSPVMGESIVGHFRVIQKGKAGEQKAVFYEFWTVELEGGTAVFKMKHFHHGLIGWEEKGDVVRLETRVDGPQNVLFTRPDGTLSLRYELRGDELISTLHQMKNGSTHDELFHLQRSR